MSWQRIARGINGLNSRLEADDCFSSCKDKILMDFSRAYYRLKLCSSLGSIFLSFIDLWVKGGIGTKQNKFTCSK